MSTAVELHEEIAVLEVDLKNVRAEILTLRDRESEILDRLAIVRPNTKGRKRLDPVARVLSRLEFVDKWYDDGTVRTRCLEWRGARSGNDYGQIEIDGRKITVHRWAYRQWVGPIPTGCHVDHLCRNPLCCNPRHLEAVTIKENIRRGEGPSAANAAKTHCANGHAFDADNTWLHKGRRACIACKRERTRQWRLRQKGAEA